jgi:NADPH-dependent 2,4-dienoyl-CoA reductase/sulfur reductase-like enzyme/nitrite reductase/ring-hydroxylating ferredoxin subunit
MEHDLCAAAEIAEGEMRAFEVDGTRLLVARSDGACHAIGAICPHAGGPLVEGVLHGGKVTCPWHKAAFEIGTGRRTSPPAVDDLPRFPLRIVGGRILVSLDGQPAAVERPAAGRGSDARCMVVIGAGAAGAVAAQTLREEGFAGRVVMIGREPCLPYDRTLLSKYTLSGKQGGEKSPLQAEDFYARHGIERRTGEVTAIDATRRRIILADGELIEYAAALVATGGTPRKLPVPGADLPGVFALRSIADAEAIVAAASPGAHVVIAGAGFVGMEAAASLRERGLAVTVVAPESAPFEKQLGARIGTVYRHVHEQQGIHFRLGDQVEALEGDGRLQRVRLRSGDVVPADLVIAGMGIAPATSLFGDMQRRKDGGVDVDAHLRVVDGLFAAGDIAGFPLRGAGPQTRVEHWRVAQQQGRIAALNMLGGNAVFGAVPYFWTIHFLKRLDYVGHAEVWDAEVIDGDLQKPEFIAYYLKDGVVAAVAGWGRDQQMACILALMEERHEWKLDTLREALGGCKIGA